MPRTREPRGGPTPRPAESSGPPPGKKPRKEDPPRGGSSSSDLPPDVHRFAARVAVHLREAASAAGVEWRPDEIAAGFQRAVAGLPDGEMKAALERASDAAAKPVRDRATERFAADDVTDPGYRALLEDAESPLLTRRDARMAGWIARASAKRVDVARSTATRSRASTRPRRSRRRRRRGSFARRSTRPRGSAGTSTSAASSSEGARTAWRISSTPPPRWSAGSRRSATRSARRKRRTRRGTKNAKNKNARRSKETPSARTRGGRTRS